MPVPNKNEQKDKFISRCIPIVINEGTTKDSKQAAAICFSIWKQHHKNAKSNLVDGLAEEFLKTKANATECPNCKSSAEMKPDRCNPPSFRAWHCNTCSKHWTSRDSGPLIENK